VGAKFSDNRCLAPRRFRQLSRKSQPGRGGCQKSAAPRRLPAENHQAFEKSAAPRGCRRSIRRSIR